MRQYFQAQQSSVASSAATSKRIDPFTFLHKTTTISGRDATRGEQMLRELQGYSAKDSRTRAETEQWSQMQEMLQQVRGEKEELQASRDFWENPALDFAREIQSLQSSLRIWFLVSNDKFDEISFDLNSSLYYFFKSISFTFHLIRGSFGNNLSTSMRYWWKNGKANHKHLKPRQRICSVN